MKKSESWGESKNDSKGEVADQCTSKLSLKKKKRQSRLDVLFLTDEKRGSLLWLIMLFFVKSQSQHVY